MSNENKLDPYVTIEGKALIKHFNAMDVFIWNSLYLIAQVDPIYLQQKVASLILKYVSGHSSGRRFFIKAPNKKLISLFLENLRTYLLTKNTLKFLENLKKFKLYRDTLREWAIDYRSCSGRVGKQLLIWKRSYFKVREQLIIGYLPLVAAISTKYGLTEDKKADLYQIGTTGLIHAIERYNNLNSINFHLFAKQWIRQRILMAISRQMPIIKVSHSLLEAESKISKQERITGKKDLSAKAQHIRQLTATKDVLLIESPDTVQHCKEDLSVDLDVLPSKLKKIIIINHDLLDHAKCQYNEKKLHKEARRQVKAYFTRKERSNGKITGMGSR